MNRFFCLLLFFTFMSCNTTQTSTTPVSTTSVDKTDLQTLTYDNFDELMKEGEGLQMAYFWASWCGPCRTIAPAIDNISISYKNQLRIGKLDVDAHKVTADLNNVSSIPAFLFFKDGVLVFQTSGLVTEQYLVNVIERLL